MAKTYEIPCAQAPKYAHAISSAANTALDGSGTLITLFTAGAEGAIVSKLDFWAQATVTATRCNVFISIDGGTTWLDDGSTFTANGVWIGDVVRRGQQVRLGVKTGNYTNGTVVCRLSRGGVE